ncbi:MAG TPA: hypothetical protein VFG17_11765 [Sphingopyxis sp.]|nr:hypothetical protein [Sphingopyxis sp.]
MLNILHLIGNICRHGNGNSVSILHGLRPDLWRTTDYHPVDLKPYPHVPTADSLRIDPELLDEFATAIKQFWFDLETKLSNSEPPGWYGSGRTREASTGGGM